MLGPRHEGGRRTRGYGPRMSFPSNPVVSVITVVLNGDDFLEIAIQSVLAQDYPNIEYIIIDGGSTDNTLNIIEEYEHHIDYWISERDRGIFDGMNKGLDLCCGDIIGILNSDDWYEPDAVNNVMKAFAKNSSVGLVCGAMRIWAGDGKSFRIKKPRNPLPNHFAMPFNHSTCFFRKDIYAEIGNFDSSFYTAADYDLVLRFLNSGGCVGLAEGIISNFRLGGITSQYSSPPVGQIWRVLRKNGFGPVSAFMGLAYRVILNLLRTMQFWRLR